MIKSLREARIIDALPRIVGKQEWVKALSESVGTVQVKILDYADKSQIYTALDDAPEAILDTLAINWKIDWYDTGYSLQQKRRIVKTALTVRRLMGTVRAVKLQLDAVYPGTVLEEWFEYGGKPGCFRLYINVTESTEDAPVITYPPEEVERRLITSKRWSAHLESLSYMVKRGIEIGHKIFLWSYFVPECGTIRCGTWWMRSTLGWSERHRLTVQGSAGAFETAPELSGTLPDWSARGYSISGSLRVEGRGEGFAISPEYAGTVKSGTVWTISKLGWSERRRLTAQGSAGAFDTAPEFAGTLPEASAKGYSVLETDLHTGGQTVGFEAAPPYSGIDFSGTMPEPSMRGYTAVCGMVRAGGRAEEFETAPELAGTLPDMGPAERKN